MAGCLIAVGLAMTLVGASPEDADQPTNVTDTTSIPVAKHPLDAGITIDATMLEWRSYPNALVPEEVVVDPVGRTASAWIAAGEPLVQSRLDGAIDATPGPVAGSVAIAVNPASAMPPLDAGDQVSLLVAGDPYAPTTAPPAYLTRDARVLATDPGNNALTVQIAADEAPALAEAIGSGALITVVAEPDAVG